jgi:flavorubredoxin
MMFQQKEFAAGNHYFSINEAAGPGLLMVNNFAIKGSRKTMLVDTNIMVLGDVTAAAVGQVMNLAELDYIFISHMDIDHVGGIQAFLKQAPKARIVGSMTVMGKGQTLGIPAERFVVAMPGDEIDLGDRLIRVQDSLVEDGHTHWLYDTKTGTAFTSDAFGALHLGPVVQTAEEMSVEAFAQGFMIWQAMAFNSLPRYEVRVLQEAVKAWGRSNVKQIASTHGPVISDMRGMALELMSEMPLLRAEMPAPPPLPAHMRVC